MNIEEMPPEARQAWGDLFSGAALIFENKDVGAEAFMDQMRERFPRDLLMLAVCAATAVGWLAERGVPDGLSEDESRESVLTWLRHSAASMREQ